MKKIKMIGLDLDGTLLNSKKEVTDHTKSVLEEAIAQGIIVLVATKRRTLTGRYMRRKISYRKFGVITRIRICGSM